MAEITAEVQAMVLNKFAYHPPSNEAVVAGHEGVRNAFRTVAEFLMEILPDSPETYQALLKLDEACMQANAAMARTQGDMGHGGAYPQANVLLPVHKRR